MIRTPLSNARLSLLGGFLLFSYTTMAWPYNDAITHPELSSRATQLSSLYNDALMSRLGLPPTSVFRFHYRARINDRLLRSQTQYTIAELVGEGAFDEDIGDRALNHFYDPLLDRPLTALGSSRGLRSWEWMLESNGPIAGQNYSLVDAKGYLYKALTYNEGTPQQSNTARGLAWRDLFLSLGAAMHHMQDMAQPQHVRNDQHCDVRYCLSLYNPSLYEAYTAQRSDAVNALAAGAQPVYPGGAEFKIARDFWFNDAGLGTGIAQWTNRNFLSQGTNFRFRDGQVRTGTYPVPEPGATTDHPIAQLFAEAGETPSPEITTLCADPVVDCIMTMYSTPLSAKASTLSIFDQDLQAEGLRVVYTDQDRGGSTYETERLFALNRFNFDDAHKMLIPVAVAYSAGLINHFFRGQMEITLPDEGVYGIVDHSTGQGFQTIKLKLKNTTPDNEAMSGGTLVAVAKFHRNGCYRPDLSGEFTRDASGTLITPCNDYRTNLEEVVVSNEVNAAFGSANPQPFTFTFPTPIPVNATDLYLQVVYKGVLGSEDDAVVVATKDLFEPSYLAFFNFTDYILYNGTFLPTTSPLLLPPLDWNQDGLLDARYDQDNMNVNFRFTGSFDDAPLGTIRGLPPGRFGRVVLLTDRSPYPSPISVASDRVDFYAEEILRFFPETNQLDNSARVYRVAEFLPVRGIPAHAGLLIYRSYPYQSDGVPIQLVTQLPALTEPAPYPVTGLYFE